MDFCEPRPCSVDTANGFMVEQVKKTLMWNRVEGLRSKFSSNMKDGYLLCYFVV